MTEEVEQEQGADDRAESDEDTSCTRCVAG